MDECLSGSVLWKSSLLAELTVDRNNAPVESNKSLQDGSSKTNPTTSPSVSSPLTPGTLASACHGSHEEGAHSHSDNEVRAAYTASPSSPAPTEHSEQSTAIGFHNEGLTSQHVVVTNTRSNEEVIRVGLISSIEAIVRYLVKDLASNATSVYTTVRARVRSLPSATTTSHITTPSIVTSRPSFPGRTTQEAWRFSK